jgi:hypothetical protein
MLRFFSDIFGGTLGKHHRYDTESPLSAESYTDKRPEKKVTSSLSNMLRPNSIYKIASENEILYIFSQNKDIRCDVFSMDPKTRKKRAATFNELCLSRRNTEGQNEIYDEFEVGTDMLSFTIIGKNVGNDTEFHKNVINNLWMDHIYVITDELSNYKHMIVIKYSAPTYKNFEDKYSRKQLEIIAFENMEFQKFIDSLNVQQQSDEYLQKMRNISSEMSLPTCEDLDEKSRGSVRSASAASGVGSMEGGSKKDVEKYKKYLRNRPLDKLYQIANNKKINCERKYKGYIVKIKQETIIENLCVKYSEMKS